MEGQSAMFKQLLPLTRSLTLTSENVESECTNGNSHHFLAMIEEFNGLCVEWEVIGMLVEKEVYCVRVQLQRKRL